MISTTNKLNMKGRKTRLYGLSLLLMASFASSANTPLDEAMKHIEQGRWSEAKTLLNYQLKLEPEHHRAKLELAMVLMQLRQYREAEVHLDELMAIQALPDAVKFNIGVMLQQLPNTDKVDKPLDQNKGSHDWNVTLGVAMGYDSNVRFSFGDYYLEDDPYTDGSLLLLSNGTYIFFAPDGNFYNLDGSLIDSNLLNIDFGPREQDTSYYESQLYFEHTYSHRLITWNNSLLVQNSDNKEFSDFDKTLYKWLTEFRVPLAENTELSMELQHRTLVRGGETLLTGNSVLLGYNWINHYGNFEVYTQWLQRDFSDSETKRGDVTTYARGFDNDGFVVGFEWSNLLFDKSVLTKINLEHRKNEASDGLDYDGLSAKVAAVYKFHQNWSLAAYLSYFEQEYERDEITNGENDTSYKFGVKLDHKFDHNKEWYIGVDRGFRDSDLYGDISSQKTNVKLGVTITF